jgi:hypothetical protein
MKKINLLSILVISAAVSAHALPRTSVKDVAKDPTRDAVRGTAPGKSAKSPQELAEDAKIKTEVRNAVTNSRGALKNVEGISRLAEELPNSGIRPALNDLVSLKNSKLSGNNVNERMAVVDSGLRLLDSLSSRADLLEMKETKNDVSTAIGFIKTMVKAAKEGNVSPTELNNMDSFAKHIVSELAANKTVKEAVESFGRFTWDEFVKRCK